MILLTWNALLCPCALKCLPFVDNYFENNLLFMQLFTFSLSLSLKMYIHFDFGFFKRKKKKPTAKFAAWMHWTAYLVGFSHASLRNSKVLIWKLCWQRQRQQQSDNAKVQREVFIILISKTWALALVSCETFHLLVLKQWRNRQRERDRNRGSETGVRESNKLNRREKKINIYKFRSETKV